MASKSFECPACGEDVPAKAKACPHCGACDKSGWGDASGDGLDLPEDDFDYEKFTAEKFSTPRKSRDKWSTIKVIGVALLVFAVVGYVLSFTFF